MISPFIFLFFASLITSNSRDEIDFAVKFFRDELIYFQNWLLTPTSDPRSNLKNHGYLRSEWNRSSLLIDSITPESIEKVNIKYLVFTGNKPQVPLNLRYNFTRKDLANFSFNSGKKTKFIIHGYMNQFGEDGWTGELKNLILRHAPDKYNVIAVDWSKVSNKLNYFRAVANVPAVAAATVIFIMRLREFVGINLDGIHFIGHSIGAHVAGIVGKHFTNPQIERITALDPAGPGFRKNDNMRLAPTDAKLVEAIHSDSGPFVLVGFGTSEPLGHIDYFPNGGYKSPACTIWKVPYFLATFGIIGGLVQIFGCDHGFASQIITQDPKELIDDCQFVGYECESYESFKKGYCSDCGKSGEKCAAISIYEGQLDSSYRDQQNLKADRSSQGSGKLFFKTDGEKKFCLHHYGIIIHTSSQSGSAYGPFRLSLYGERHKEDEIKLGHVNEKFEGGKSYPFLITNRRKFGKIRTATLEWLSDISVRSRFVQKVFFARIEVRYMSNISPRKRQTESTLLCANYQTNEGGQSFSSC